MNNVLTQSAGLVPPLEKGRVTREARRVGIVYSLTPTRQAALADLPLSGGGMETA
jgi:hypothetical protein